MSGNEILINLNNVENLGQQEMMAGLLELIRKDKKGLYDWNTNPITAKCIEKYTAQVRGYNAKRTIQGAMMLSMLRIRDPKAWDITSRRILFLLHKYTARDFAFILHLFDQVKDLEYGEEEDVISPEALYQKNWKSVSDVIPENFFERVVGLLPMFIA